MIKYLIIVILVIVNIVLFCKIVEEREKYQASSGSLCDPDDADVSGNTVIKCVENCSKSIHCSEDDSGNTIDIIPLAQQYLNKYPNVHINPPGPSDPETLELSKCSILNKLATSFILLSISFFEYFCILRGKERLFLTFI